MVALAGSLHFNKKRGKFARVKRLRRFCDVFSLSVECLRSIASLDRIRWSLLAPRPPVSLADCSTGPSRSCSQSPSALQNSTTRVVLKSPALVRPSRSRRCQSRPNLSQKVRSKFPHADGLRSRRFRVQGTVSGGDPGGAGVGAWPAGLWSRCARAGVRRAGAGDSWSPRSDDDGVMQEPIEERSGDHRIAEQLALFAEAAVGGEDRGAALVAGVVQLDEQVAAARD
jgi:hypothetical protein